MQFLDRLRTQDLHDREEDPTERARRPPGKRSLTMAVGRAPKATRGSRAPGRRTRTMSLPVSRGSILGRSTNE